MMVLLPVPTPAAAIVALALQALIYAAAIGLVVRAHRFA
jgi:hypothetical protein